MNTILGIVLVLGLMILVHELGHFIVARVFGVRVDVFSIGFGPRLFGWKRGATDYRVSALPFGGYVRMAGQDLSEVDSADVAPTGAPDELMSKPRWQRALISVAGPAVNLIMPLLLLSGFFWIKGLPYSAYLDQPPVIASMKANDPLAKGGVAAGDRIVAVNGSSTPTWEKVDEDGKAKFRLGVGAEERWSYKRMSFGTAVESGSVATWYGLKQLLGVVGRLFSGKQSVKMLLGPVGIIDQAGQAVQEGSFAVVNLMAIISLNLVILNLFLIPILDGWYILLITLEGIRRRDFSLAFKERFVQVGLVFLLVFFAYVMYNDVVRLLPTHS